MIRWVGQKRSKSWWRNTWMPPYQKLERNALIWSYFQNVWCGRLWGHWGQRIFAVEFRGYGPEILFSFLIVWLSTLRKLSQTVPEFWLIDFIALDLFDFGNDIDFKNGHTKHFENSLKSMHFFPILMGGMNFRWRSHLNQISSPGRGA